MNLEEYFARTGYKGSTEKQDLETLTNIFQHHIRAVPFENLSIHCGEKITLELEHVYNKIVRRKRGGWCMENNQLLGWVLRGLGYETSFLGAYVFNPHQNAYATLMTHLVVKVVIDGKAYVVDGGFGVSYQMWQPMELISGTDQPQTPGIFRFQEENGTWYLEKVKRKQWVLNPSTSTSPNVENEVCHRIYLFTLQPRNIEEFMGCNVHLQTAPDSKFVLKSMCSMQTADGIRTLVGWKLTEIKYNYRDNMDLVEIRMLAEEELETILKEKFTITLDKKFVPVDFPRFF